MIEYIVYNGVEYPITDVVINDWGWETIGTESLEAALMPNGKFNDEEAEAIDGNIFYYVPDEMIDASDLAKYVMYHTM